MKFKVLTKLILHFIVIILLTITTQVGGVIYLISIVSIHKSKSKFKVKRTLLFTFLYLITTYLIVPEIAPFFGREKIAENKNLVSHSFITKLCNRNYLTPNLHAVLTDASLRMNKEFPGIKTIYLDSNFPFFDGFPLLPHLSHNDEKKIDISFIYEDENGKTTNLKPSISGYGAFEEPIENEINQTKNCKNNGYWQYDFTKYVTFGTINKNLKVSEKATKFLIQEILKHKSVSKIFIEPHLKNRLKLNHSKIRFHGCRAVRHDDHIHFQIN